MLMVLLEKRSALGLLAPRCPTEGRRDVRLAVTSLSASEAAHAVLECSVVQGLAYSFLVHLEVSL